MIENKKRVLYISYDCITEPLSQSQVLPYLKGLSQNYEMYLLTFNKKKIGEEELSGLSKRYGLDKIFYLAYHKKPSLPATVFDIFCGIIKALFIVWKYKISFIHARSYVACAISLALKKICGIPYIFDIRGLLADERADSGDWKKDSVSYRAVKVYEKAMIKDAAKIVILSHRGVPIVDNIVPGSKDKIFVIPTCADTELFAPSGPGSGGTSLRFIYIGSLGTWYMLPEMLEFFKVAARVVNGSKFTILTWSDQEIVKNFVKAMGIDENSVTVKREPHDRIPYYLRENDASLFFIRPTFSKKVSCPTKFAESLSMSLPVITNSGVGDIGDYIKKYSVGVVVDNFKADEYEKAVKDIVHMLSQREALAARCRSLALKEFSLTSGVEKYKNIYESMI